MKNDSVGLPKAKNTKKNYIYNLLYQVFMLIIPLLVTPYVSRVLGESGMGKYSFSFAIVRYFMVFATLGFSHHSQRLIASHQGDKYNQSKDFWEVMLAKSLPVLSILVIQIILISFNVYGKEYQILMWIYLIEMFAVALDTVFFFYGNEEFGKVVFKKVVVQIVSIVSIFLFVKDETDIWVYALVQVVSIFIGYVILWGYLPKHLVKIKFKELKPFRHFKPALLLFLPVVATQLYAYIDKILIGFITGDPIENGNYEVADNLIKMALTSVTAMGVVMLPHNAHKLAKGDVQGVRDNVYSSIRFVWFMGVPLMLGCIAIVDRFIPWYLDGGYNKTANLMKILSFMIIFMGIINVLGEQYLLPSKRDKQYTVAILSGALINLGLNVLFINFWQSYGAAIATVISELCIVFIMALFTRKEFNYWKILTMSWKYLIAGGIMFVACYFVSLYLPATIFATVLSVCVGGVVYLVCLIILREVFVFNTISKVFKRKPKQLEEAKVDKHEE